MTITLNVLITLAGPQKIFSIWSEPIANLPGIELAVGGGFTISDAVDDWYDKLPDYFFIDDETSFYKERLQYRIKRPFMVQRGEYPKTMKAN